VGAPSLWVEAKKAQSLMPAVPQDNKKYVIEVVLRKL